MLSNPNSATSKSPDWDHGDIRFDRTQAASYRAAVPQLPGKNPRFALMAD
jgi:hypothetical protein